EVAHPQEAAPCFTHQSKRRNGYWSQRLLQFFLVGGLGRIRVLQLLLNLRSERLETLFQLRVAQRPNLGFLRIDGGNDWLELLNIAFVLCSDKSGYDAVEYLCCFHVWFAVS